VFVIERADQDHLDPDQPLELAVQPFDDQVDALPLGNNIARRGHEKPENLFCHCAVPFALETWRDSPDIDP
jgi:hypothetical protein